MAIPLLPAPRMSANVERRLTDLVEERMLTPAREAGYELALVGATVLPQHQTIAKTERGSWLFVDHVEDPTAGEYGGQLPVPPREFDHLIDLDRIGVRPQLVWIGHQLPADYRDGDPIPRLVPPPRQLREKDQRLTLRLGAAARMWGAALGAMVVAPVAASVAALGAIGTDPIIFGGVRHPEQPVVAWCVLCSWDWE
jgi:hypothetical protein